MVPPVAATLFGSSAHFDGVLMVASVEVNFCFIFGWLFFDMMEPKSGELIQKKGSGDVSRWESNMVIQT